VDPEEDSAAAATRQMAAAGADGAGDADMEETEPLTQTASQRTDNTEGTTNSSSDKSKRKGRPPAYPCLCCGENCTKSQLAARCIMCTLWAHKDCIKMPDATYKALEVQKNETGTAFWVCRPCQSFGQRVQHQFAESNKRHDITEKRVEANARKIEEAGRSIEELRSELKRVTERLNKESEQREDKLCDEMQEREVRRMNLIIHGVDEQPDGIRGNIERMEKDKERCEKIFKAVNARTRKDDLRFCRRIGERGADPRPIVIGLETEEEKRHILGRARDLRNTSFRDVSIVPDLTRKQRNREARMKEEADEKNKTLTADEKNRNVKWMVVGRRGEKRLIKGVERDQQRYGDTRDEQRVRYQQGAEQTSSGTRDEPAPHLDEQTTGRADLSHGCSPPPRKQTRKMVCKRKGRARDRGQK
jgi:hypothetical protein